jgi:DNA-binding transcriptional MerR regulator/methylmalonyl-CoA mutase cobalamin-binding subunit
MNNRYNISEVSQQTGIPKDLLRQWERRYGYPDPLRLENGDRAYDHGQVEKLLLIRQLTDQGKRPGKLVPLNVAALKELLIKPKAAFDPKALIKLLTEGDPQTLHHWLQQQLNGQGLRAFIHQILTPATQAVGEAWAKGELPIHKEHLYTEAVKVRLRKAIAELDLPASPPRTLLTTVPGEQHGLGLLMVEALLRLGGAEVISLGTEMPFQEIKEAAEHYQVDIVALSFSARFQTDDAIVILTGLRQLLGDTTTIWAGGGAFRDLETAPQGIAILGDLAAIERELARWRRNTGPFA